VRSGVEGDFGNVGNSLSGVDDYMKSAKLHNEIPMPDNFFMTIDTSSSIDPQLDELERKLRAEEAIE
jgi:hypothetical protein